jgi:hypothetical protein
MTDEIIILSTLIFDLNLHPFFWDLVILIQWVVKTWFSFLQLVWASQMFDVIRLLNLISPITIIIVHWVD